MLDSNHQVIARTGSATSLLQIQARVTLAIGHTITWDLDTVGRRRGPSIGKICCRLVFASNWLTVNIKVPYFVQDNRLRNPHGHHALTCRYQGIGCDIPSETTSATIIHRTCQRALIRTPNWSREPTWPAYRHLSVCPADVLVPVWYAW